jgi:outer membrane immunogenic protein
MKKYLLATVSIVALTGSVSAADLMLSKAPIASVAPSWAGPYVGGSVGVARHNAGYDDFDAGGGGTIIDSATTHSSSTTGVIGGLFIGYNWQMGSLVYGLEGDINWLDSEVITEWRPGHVRSAVTSHEVPWLSTIRGRAGLAVDRTLMYFTGGLAIANVNNRASTSEPFGPDFAEVKQDETVAGWTAGVGIEHMWTNNWTARAELLYVDLGRTLVNGGGALGAAGNSYSGRFTNELLMARVGVAYKW